MKDPNGALAGLVTCILAAAIFYGFIVWIVKLFIY